MKVKGAVMKKRIIPVTMTMLMSLVMALAMIPLLTAPAYAAGGFHTECEEGFKVWIEPDKGTAIICGRGQDNTDADITIPATVTYDGTTYSVKGIDSGSFENDNVITGLTVSSGITDISENAFFRCTNLTSITLPDSMEKVSKNSFEYTGYYNDTNNWEDGVLYINNILIEAKSGVTQCEIKNGTVAMADGAFETRTSLKSVTIPSSITSIGENTFYYCTNLESITIPDSVTSIGGAAFKFCGKLTSIQIPDSVTSIGISAFHSSGLTSVTIPDSVTYIGGLAFNSCTSLTSVTISNSVTTIGDDTFRSCGLTNVTIPKSVTSIDMGAFESCANLTAVTFENGSKLESIGKFAFRESGLTSITIPNSVTSIGKSAFADCSSLDTVYFYGTEAQWNNMSARDSGWAGDQEKRVVFLMIEVPEGKTLIYNGEEQTGVDEGTGYTLTDTTSATNAGSYQATAKLNNEQDIIRYVWADGTTTDKTIAWKIDKAAAKVTVPSGKTLTYDGKEQIGVEEGDEYTLTGASETNAGSYTATATLKENPDPNYVYEWADGTRETKTITWKIDKAAAKVTVPSGKTLTYDGKEQIGVEEGDEYTLAGASATNAGSYTATATLKENPDPNYVYEWADGTREPKAITWKIDKAVAKVTVPSDKTLTYDGKEQIGVEEGDEYTLAGASATNAGSYTATATLKENPDPNYVYEWSDGTKEPKTINWTISHEHKWGAPTYEWAKDNSTVAAMRVCGWNADHTETETVNVTAEVTKPATCTAKGETTYTATFTNEAFSAQTKTIANVQIDLNAHDWDKGEVTTAPTCSAKGVKTFRCNNDPAHIRTEEIAIDPNAHKLRKVGEKPATTDAEGIKEHWKCENCSKLFIDEAGTKEITQADTVIPKLKPEDPKPTEPTEEEKATAEARETLSSTLTDAGKVIQGNYTDESYQALQAAIVEAEKVAANDKATAAELKAAAEKVAAAKAALKDKAAEPEPQPEPVIDPTKEMGADGTPFGKGASAEAAEKAITSRKNDNDPKGSVFAPLMLKSTKQGKTSISLTWRRAKGAKKYVIYGNACGKKTKFVKVTTTNKLTYNVKKINRKALKKAKYHKFIVVALDSKGKVVTTSKVIHVATKGKGNPTKVKVSSKVKKNKLSLKMGKTVKLAGKAVGKKVTQHVKVRYESSNPKIASVDKNGKVKGVKKGKCKIYAYAQNGVCTIISVSVKAK